MAELIFFLPPSFPPLEISLFWGTSIAITPCGTQNVILTPMRGKYSIESSPLTSFPSMTLTYLLFTITHIVVAPLLTSSLPPPPPLLPYPAPGRCFRTWILITYQFLLTVPLSPVFRPNKRLSSFNFQKAHWDDFAFYFDSHCPSA